MIYYVLSGTLNRTHSVDTTSQTWTCIKWYSTYSRFIKIEFGVRQGSVLAPSLFAVYIDDVVSRLSLSQQQYFIILYADDILMISPSVTELQNIVSICERELNLLDMQINIRKSRCMRNAALVSGIMSNVLIF